VLILLAYILSILHALAGIPGAAEQFNTDLSAPVLISVITCFYLIFLLISARKLHFANKPYFTILGALTYPLYLIHQNIGFIIFNHFSSETYKYLTLPLTIATSLLLAYLINKYIERRYSGSLKQLLNWLVTTFPLLFKKQRLTQH
jgi:peptidoglycan/LPS O-acetylase OafA/YrhL